MNANKADRKTGISRTALVAGLALSMALGSIPTMALAEVSMGAEDASQPVVMETQAEPTPLSECYLNLDGNVVIVSTSGSGEKIEGSTSPWSDIDGATSVKFVGGVQPPLLNKMVNGVYITSASCALMFLNCRNFQSLDLTGLDTTGVDDMRCMFKGCTNLTSIEGLSRLDTSSVTDMSDLFYGCSSLTTLNLSGWDTRAVETFTGMFRECPPFTDVTLGANYVAKDNAMIPKLADGYTWKDAKGNELTLEKAHELIKTQSPSRGAVTASKALVHISKATIAKIPDQTYTGVAAVPEPEVMVGDTKLVKDVDYYLEYKDNDKVGTATITVVGKGAYTGTSSITFTITEATSTPTPGTTPTSGVTDLVQATISAIPDQPYTGKAIEPKPEVKLGEKVLEEGTDYTLTYKDNVVPGIATITVTGTGAYTGTKETSFRVTFADVSPEHWAYDVVHRANNLRLVFGYSGANKGKFGLEDKLTRGQAAVILWHMAGNPDPGADAEQFPDVKAKMYYTDAVAWARKVGVACGYVNGNFGPDDPLTREQFASMVANYARNVAGKETPGSAEDYKDMKDADKVAKFAENSVGWCFRSKILSGTKEGYINPYGTATRAEATKMLLFLHDLLEA